MVNNEMMSELRLLQPECYETKWDQTVNLGIPDTQELSLFTTKASQKLKMFILKLIRTKIKAGS